MKLRLIVHEARSGRESFRVVRPARPPAHAELLDDSWYLNAYLDREAALLMAGLWTLAASSPRTLVHLPLRTAGGRTPGDRALDLVLLHHSLRFPPAHWKRLRARLGPGRPRTVDLRPPEPREDPDGAYPRHADDRDRFHQHIHAETLFLTGSAPLFRRNAGLFRDVALRGPAHPRTAARHGHYCREVDCGVRFRGLHVQYADPDGVSPAAG
ncbi:hypothetical protein [Streptomyces sp. SPB4]|uniref:hypothetical protein n=1 Tax=Streptomyces TaxID=1883 RepID=UPI0024751196|nr:hypothetical protein [Streptomyces sp. SPB4]MDH6538454.1 hypothetical protein [Streptomyces sp. SPB4]